MYGGAAGSTGTEAMGLEEKLPSGILLTTVERVINWARKSSTWGATLFAGPKEYARLSKSENFKHSEDLVMQFSTGFGKVFFSGFFSPLLLTIMNWVHSWVPNWGLAIILMTILLKVATLPFTFAASRSSKRTATRAATSPVLRLTFATASSAYGAQGRSTRRSYA